MEKDQDHRYSSALDAGTTVGDQTSSRVAPGKTTLTASIPRSGHDPGWTSLIEPSAWSAGPQAHAAGRFGKLLDTAKWVVKKVKGKQKKERQKRTRKQRKRRKRKLKRLIEMRREAEKLVKLVERWMKGSSKVKRAVEATLAVLMKLADVVGLIEIVQILFAAFREVMSFLGF